jgi:serine/threonine protein kinase
MEYFKKSIEFDVKGNFNFIDEKHNNEIFFRKNLMKNTINFYHHEKKICEIIKSIKHPNIVQIYDVNEKYIDIELVNTDFTMTKDIKTKMFNVCKFLNKLGIAYIDWKVDNIGIGNDGEPKLFDFNCSGIFDYKTNIWIYEPPNAFMYRTLKSKINNNSIIYIDELAFSKGLKV